MPSIACNNVFAGELLASFHPQDVAALRLMAAIRAGTVPGVQLVEDLNARLHDLELTPREVLSLSFARLSVPEGDEGHFVMDLQYHYKLSVFEALQHGWMDFQHHGAILLDPRNHFCISPHHLLSVAAPPPPPAPDAFTFDTSHDTYKQMLKWKSGTPSVTRRVLILDTGVESTSFYNVVDYRNFVSDNTYDVTDDHQDHHGTAVAMLIHDLCPSAELTIFKVANDKGKVSEWDVLASLAAQTGASLINMSLTFGELATRNCLTCRRASHSSRSAVFDNMLTQVHQDANGPLIVVAAGNEAQDKLAFPARFNTVVAIEAIDSQGELATFSNRGALDQDGNDHPNVFVMPGGQQSATKQPTEYVGISRSGEHHTGTSFSAAYATGLIAALWSEPGYKDKNRQEMLDLLKQNADTNLPNYTRAKYGNGLMQFV